MEKIKILDQKIASLKEKKILLQRREAEHLSKEIQLILKESFSTPLALAIVRDSWKNSTREQKENWLKSSASFRASASSKTDKASPQNPATSQPNLEKKGTPHAHA
jgi:hypothetical protein